MNVSRLAVFLAIALFTANCGSRNTESTTDDGGGTIADQFVNEAGTVDNSLCKRASRLALKGGSVTVTGSTAGFSNEYGTQVNCGASFNTMLGSQVYYRVALTKAKSYKVSLSASFSSGRIYLFRGCGAGQINADCGSEGKTGDVTSSSATSSSAASFFFTPSATRDYLIAVDSTSSSKSNNGDFTLIVEEFTAPTNVTCAKAQRLTLTGGKVSVQGSTEGAKNEFGTGINCGSSSYTLKGGQAYYKVGLTSGQSYIVSVTPQFSFARFYIFGGACDMNNINAACGSKGVSGDFSGTIFKDKPSQIVFTASKTADYTIAVDSSSESYSGKFTLGVESFKRPVNDTCAKATAVTVKGAKTTVTGTTYGASNQYPGTIKCTSTLAADGPQVYYKLTWNKSQTYKFTVSPSFSAKFYIFNSTCDGTSINADCGSRGQTGAYLSAYSSSTVPNLLFYRAPATTGYMAIDSSSNNYFGSFKVDIEPFTAAANGRCQAAKALTFTSGTVKTTGDTTGVPNEFGTAINCGNYKSIPYGSQVYYKVPMLAGKSYDISLTPDFSSAKLYVFGFTCSATKINADCGSKGKTGDVYSGYISKGKTSTLTLKPTASGTYIVAVDATSDSSYSYGTFALQITEK